MNDQDNSYRPRSPDLSTFKASTLTPSSSSASASTYPTLHPSPLASPLGHRASYDASPFFTSLYQRPVAPASRVSQQYVPPVSQARLNYSNSSSSTAATTTTAAAAAFDMARRSARVAARPVEVMPSSVLPSSTPDPAYPTYPEPAAAPVPIQPFNPAAVEVKTKFPVARIKRIMQADEDVGKVAQVTPIAVCTYDII